MTIEPAAASGRPIVAPGSGVSVVIAVAHGKSLEDCLGAMRPEPGRAPAEVLLVDVRDDRAAHDDLRRLVAASRTVGVRVLATPGASVAEARAVGLAAARHERRLLLDEAVLLPPGALEELLAPGAGVPMSLAQRLDLVRDLQDGAVQCPDDPGFAERAVRDQAERIRAVLLAEPDRHGEVVAGARDRGITDLPWDVVNRGRARDLAILYCFVPFIDTSGLVAARRLREWGVVTDVVSQDLSGTARVDEAGLRIPGEVLDEARIIPGRRQVHRWPSVLGFVEDALAVVADLEAAKGPYRALYSRAMPPASHFAAAVHKLRSPGLRWVAEFSDPLLYNAFGEIRIGDVEDGWLLAELSEGFRRAGYAVPDTDRLFGWAELVAYAFADEIIFTNEHQRDFMLGYCADPALAERARGITTVLHHPVPGPELYELAHPAYPLPEGLVHIGYFGNFYPNRGLTEVTGALDQLTLAERDRLQLHVFTSRPEALQEELLEHGFADVIRVSPMFGYLEYLNLITRFDVLLINDYATSPHFVPNPYLPAKLADYRGSGTRIWSLYEPGSILSASAVDHASPLGDVAAATDVLRTLLREHPETR